MTINELRDEIIKLLKDKGYRDAFVSASINVGIPSQIRALREQKQRKWSQKELGERASMAQESISRLEDPSRGSVNNIRTLLRLASVFDVGLMVRFVPFSEMAERKLKLSLESLEVESFEEESYFKDKLEVDISSVSTEQDQMAIVSKYTTKQLSDALKNAATKKDLLTAIAGNPYYVDSGIKIAA